MWYWPEGRTLATMGVVRARRSKSSRASATPARPAIAGKCTTAFVDPPRAMSTRTAFSKASRVRMRLGRRSSPTMATIRRPAASARRSRRESGAGMAAMPGRVRPRASVRAAIVLAVPITMHVPVEGKSSPWIASRRAASSAPARYSPQTRRQSVHAPRRAPSKRPVSMGPAVTTMAAMAAFIVQMMRASFDCEYAPRISSGCASIHALASAKSWVSTSGIHFSMLRR